MALINGHMDIEYALKITIYIQKLINVYTHRYAKKLKVGVSVRQNICLRLQLVFHNMQMENSWNMCTIASY